MNLPISPLLAQTPTIEESTVETFQDNHLNYLGVGGAIGLRDEGETALGDGGFSILGRTRRCALTLTLFPLPFTQP